MSQFNEAAFSDALRRLRRGTLAAPDIKDGIMGGTCFESLPAATSVAAGSDNLFVTVGTGTEVVARDTLGRANFKSQATTPADNDNCLLVPCNTTNILNQPVSASYLWRAAAVISLGTITAEFFSIGFNESITDADPTGTAGDGAMFFFIPNDVVAATELADATTFTAAGFTATQRGCWLMASKVAGTFSWAASSVTVAASTEYLLQWQIGTDRKITYSINGARVGQSPALTNAAALRFMAGIELTGTPGGQKDFSVRGVPIFRSGT